MYGMRKRLDGELEQTDQIVIRDQHGRWIPVKTYPMAVLNQKSADFFVSGQTAGVFGAAAIP